MRPTGPTIPTTAPSWRSAPNSGGLLIETRGALQRILDLGARREDGLARLKAAARRDDRSRAGGRGMSVAPSVPELLRRGALAPAHVSAVDAVMGEDWAHLELGRGSAARSALDEGRRTGAAAAGGDRRGAGAEPAGAGEADRHGRGRRTRRGLKAQMSYLSRQGDVPLVSSESTFGTELGAADAEQLAAAWGLPEADRGGADRTSHFVVSFPQGTDPEAAERAGRAWAAALFDSGAHGDRWDYYTAFHTDTAYPHIHVVVGRRGLDEGQWLRVSSRGAITFDRLREVQVEVAAREGIALTGTSRLSRGVHDRPVPDAEYRRARAEGRAAVAPEHTRGDGDRDRGGDPRVRPGLPGRGGGDRARRCRSSPAGSRRRPRRSSRGGRSRWSARRRRD